MNGEANSAARGAKSLAFPRPLGVVSRGIVQGWRYAHVDLVPPDGPRAA